MASTQDRIVGIKVIEDVFEYVNDDKRTIICASDIAQFIDEYYSEMFERIASNNIVFYSFTYLIHNSVYYSFAELAQDYMADIEGLNGCKTFAQYDEQQTLANNCGFDSYEEMEDNSFFIICDTAIDGYIVFGL